jgi:hypothetical protein
MQENAIYINRLYQGPKGPKVHKGIYLSGKPGCYIGLAIDAVGLAAANTDSLLVFCQPGRSRLQFFDAEHQLSAGRQVKYVEGSRQPAA